MTGVIMVLGPNGVGKTKLAYELARRYGGQVVNLDRTYLYRGFPLTTGLRDTQKEHGVVRHLYEFLEPHQPSPSALDFVAQVEEKIAQIKEAGCLAIVEGASTLYAPALLEENAKRRLFDVVIGLRFAAGFDVEMHYRRRIDQAFAEGLAEELKENSFAFETSALIKECHFAVPTMRYLKGHLTLKEAKEDILARCLAYKDRQLDLFSPDPQISWIEIA